MKRFLIMVGMFFAAIAGVTLVAHAASATAISAAFPWPWVIARTLGIASFILLSLLSITGMLLTTGVLYRLMTPAAAWSLHRAIGSVLLFSMIGHAGALLFDNFIRLHMVDILVPFASKYQPLWVGLGTIGFYLALLILASTLYTMTRYAMFWRTVHFFAFPMYLLIFLHGLYLGTDAHRWWMQVISWGSALGVGTAVGYRLVWKTLAQRPK